MVWCIERALKYFTYSVSSALPWDNTDMCWRWLVYLYCTLSSLLKWYERLLVGNKSVLRPPSIARPSLWLAVHRKNMILYFVLNWNRQCTDLEVQQKLPMEFVINTLFLFNSMLLNLAQGQYHMIFDTDWKFKPGRGICIPYRVPLRWWMIFVFFFLIWINMVLNESYCIIYIVPFSWTTSLNRYPNEIKFYRSFYKRLIEVLPVNTQRFDVHDVQKTLNQCLNNVLSQQGYDNWCLSVWQSVSPRG